MLFVTFRNDGMMNDRSEHELIAASVTEQAAALGLAREFPA